MSTSQKRPGKVISFYADEKTNQQIDYYSEKLGLTKSQFIKNIIEVGLDEARMLNKLGLFALGVFLRDFGDKLRKSIKKTKEDMLKDE
ncbi:MAG: hypothetical protein AB7E47_06370 [Desulfovibrionaceae bacterium]